MRILVRVLALGMGAFLGGGFNPVPAQAATNRVEMGDFFFRPNAITIAAGDSIVWTNTSNNDHDTTSGIPPTGTVWESELFGRGGTFQFTFANAGFYPYTCAQHADRNQTGSVRVAVGPLIRPNVAITSPAPNTFVVAPAAFTVAAEASDDDGQVASVQFFRGTNFLTATNSIGIDTNAPFSTNVSGLQAGTYTYVAVARDNIGLLSTSAPVNITVLGLGTSTVVISNFTFNPQTLYVAASSTVIWTNKDPVNHTVTGASDSLEALCGPDVLLTAIRKCTNRFWTPGIYPYYCSIHPSMVGTVVVLRVTSTPMVTLTNPAPGEVFLTNSLITLAADATDGNGITNVQFFNGVTSLGAVTTSPYVLSLSNLAIGSYTVTAKALDRVGLGALSDPVSFSIISPSPIHLFNPTIGGDGLFHFDYSADPGLTYLIEGSREPGRAGLFDRLQTNKAGSNPETFTDPDRRSDRLYRVRLQP